MNSVNHCEINGFDQDKTSVLIFESTMDLFSLIGKYFRQNVQQLNNYESFESRLKMIRKQLNLLKENHEATLNTITNVTTAHRDQNVKLQFETITGISWLAVLDRHKN